MLQITSSLCVVQRRKNVIIRKISGEGIRFITKTKWLEEFDCKVGELYTLEPMRDSDKWRDWSVLESKIGGLKESRIGQSLYQSCMKRGKENTNMNF